MSKMRGYIDPNEYSDHAMIALEKALETDAPIKCFRLPVRDLLTESRRLRTLNQELEKRAERAEAIAPLMQSPAVDHAEMVAKLRELSLQWRELSEAAHKDGEFDRSDVWEDASRRLEKLLSTEPADPVKVDLSAVRQVMGELRLQPYIDKDHDQCVRWANRLATAIGDTP